MANILYMAISKDGFIAGTGDETPWSDAEWEAFETFIKGCDAVLLGRRTYEVMRDTDEFVKGVRYIVATGNSDLNTGDMEKVSIETAADMPRVRRLAIIGGGELNGRLATLGVIDEMILDIEPISLYEGIRLFGDYDVPLKLQLKGSRKIGKGTIQRHYVVMKG